MTNYKRRKWRWAYNLANYDDTRWSKRVLLWNPGAVKRNYRKFGRQWHVGMTTSRHCCSSSSDASQGDGGNLRSTGGHGQTSKTNSCAERSLGRPPRRPRSPLRRGPASAALSAVYRIPYRSRVMSKIRILNIFFQGCPFVLWFLWNHDFREN